MADDVERSIKEIVSNLRKEEPAPTSEVLVPGAEVYAPMPESVRGGPEQAADAYRNISTYGEAFAKYLEQEGESILAAAQEYHSQCYQLAAAVRNTASDEADRAVKYLNRIKKLAQTLDNVKNSHEEPL